VDLAAPSRRSPAQPPFSPLWLRRLERLVVGSPVALGEGTRRVHLRCGRGAEARRWIVEVRDERIRRVRPATAVPRGVSVVGHSLTVAWRMFGLSVRGFHRIDELVIERSPDGVAWTRHPLPPLDEALLDLSADADGSVRWHERVVGSPLGTLFVQWTVADDQLRLQDASGVPPPMAVDVCSEVAWRDLMAARSRAHHLASFPPRSWRGRPTEVARVRSAIERASGAGQPASEDARRRDLDLLGAIGVFRAMSVALRGSSEWRDLWRPSVGRTS
jgi:hypothetical protein